MNEIIEKEKINIEDMIYEINGVEVMLDFEITVTKCHGYIYDKIITNYDIEKLKSVYCNLCIRLLKKIGKGGRYL